MPNYVQNRLQVIGLKEEIKKLMNYIKGEETKIDFHKIMPRPIDLEIESGSLGKLGQYILFGDSRSKFLGHEELHKRYNKLSDELKRKANSLGMKYQENIKKYGHPTWYEWSVEHWGTKWNAGDSPDERDTDNTIYFTTAWSNISKLIEKLSLIFPDIEFIYDWADENIGTNTGRIKIKNNEAWFHPIENGSIEAYELALELHHDQKEYYKLIDGKYQYIEEKE